MTHHHHHDQGQHLLVTAFSSIQSTTPTFALNRVPIRAYYASNGIASTKNLYKNYDRHFATATYVTKSSFVPPEPPSFQGQAVFPDIDLNVISDDASIRNKDRNAVFVVTGASRGIGLQIVKDLVERTKVRRQILRTFCAFLYFLS